MKLCLQWIWLARWSFTCDTVRVRSELAEAHVPFSAWQTAVRAGRDERCELAEMCGVAVRPPPKSELARIAVLVVKTEVTLVS
mmetsp:Transcript_1035/g.4258  ORF Transcript_1035/g.4258 Transcript_1035/m.4258 type:complete len:83 (-) Transcript_1035:458-706(-)